MRTDSTTQGSWKGVYGGDGYNVIDNVVAYPSYVTVTPSGQSNYIWDGSASDARALQKASDTGRILATWYTSDTFSLDINFSDSAPHQVSLYCLDWSSDGDRAETITVSDAMSSVVLDTRNVNHFFNGQYVVWNVSGHVLIKITNTGAPNAVISGLFFDVPDSVAPPWFTPTPGIYSSGQSVSFSTMSGASIRYTTDGSAPTNTVGTLYTGPIAISTSTTLKAVAYAPGYANSPVAVGQYGILAATPTLSPSPGTYSATQTVSLSTSTAGASIRYTTDGSTPSETVGTPYSGPVTISVNTTIKAIAYAAGYLNSGVATATYNIVPTISTVSPSSGVGGAQVTISGSGFGTSRGTGVLWIGSTIGTVVSWNDTQIVATVALNSRSGSVRVKQGGTWSNSVAFNVSTATITSISPAIGVPGTQVTIAGSGFGGSQGTSQVWLGSTTGVVQSWSDSQIIATVGAGAISGNAIVLVNGVLSNGVPFVVNTLHIAAVSPTVGGSGTSVTIAGTGFGASQGSGTVILGSTTGSVVSWTDTQVVATVDPTAVSGVARVQQNGASSNAFTFTVPSGNPVTVVPNLLNLVVGDTHTIQAVNTSGQSVTGLTWTTSDPTILSLSTDDPPILSALAPGHVTIKAGAASADVNVSSVAWPLGTVLWSNPGPGGVVSRVVPAVPSPTGVADVFAFNDDDQTVQAITSDGTTAWTASIANTYGVVPDFQGGLVGQRSLSGDDFTNGCEIVKWDGLTGASTTLSTDGGCGKLAVHTDGTVFAWAFSRPLHLLGVNPISGAQFTVSTTAPTNNTGVFPSDIIIAGDGFAYTSYAYLTPGGVYGINYLTMMRIDTSGSTAEFPVWAREVPPPDHPGGALEDLFAPPTYKITNADNGIVFTFRADQQHWLGSVTNGGVNVAPGPEIPGQSDDLVPALQMQDGSFVGGVSVEGVPYMVAFDQSGAVRWSVPNEEPQSATADGGLTGRSGMTYDANGNSTGQISNLPIQSWPGNSYTSSPVRRVVFTPTDYATTFAALAGGNPSAAAQRAQNTGSSSDGTYLLPETLYLRSFAPWPYFGADPFINCPAYCFEGDNRSFSTSLTVTARVTGILRFWMPGATLGSYRAFSDPSFDLYGNTKKGEPTISAGPAGATSGYKLHMEFAGSNPLFPGSPAINTKLDFTPVLNSGQICYSGHLYGDAFPNAEVFALDSFLEQAKMLLTFTTSGDPNTGPGLLLGNNNREMGSFTNQCAAK